MILDLRKNGKLDSENARKFNAVALALHRDFTQTVDNLSNVLGGSPDWWVSEIASRNTFSSDLFDLCVRFLFAVEQFENQKVEAIALDSVPLWWGLRTLLRGKKSKIRLDFYRRSFVREALTLIKIPRRFLFICFKTFYRYYLCKKYARPIQPVGANSLFVETFLFNFSFKSGDFRDRYFGEIFFQGCESQGFLVTYLPILQTSIGQMKQSIQTAARSKRAFLFPETYLTLKDVLWGLAYPFRALKQAPRNITLRGCNVTAIFRWIWLCNLSSEASIEALLRMRFVLRLAEQGQRPGTLLDWFENQSIDKGTILGFRRFLPDTKIVGYQGFVVSSHYLCMYPSEAEYQNAILPQVLAVIGENFIAERKKFCPNLHVAVAPAFRFAALYAESKSISIATNGPKILVGLNISTALSLEIIETFFSALNCLSSAEQSSFSISIRPHPTCSMSLERELARIGSKCHAVSLSDGDLYAELEACDIFIGNTSSICMEAFVMGLFVIIMGSLNGVTQNPLPDDLVGSRCLLTYGSTELADALRIALKGHREATQIESCQIRGKYFQPPTGDNTAAFVALLKHEQQ